MNEASEMEHGWFILGLSLWLFWQNVRQLPVAPNQGDRGWALLAMGVGFVIHVLGYTVQQSRISIIGVLVFVWGLSVLGGGRRWGKAAAFPLAFMVFAIPINVLDTAGFWLRMWVIEASHSLAHMVGIEVVRNGTQLFSPDGDYQYDVAAACSGIRSLMALTALSLLVGYLNFRSWWARILVLVLSFPFTYVGNVVRISAIILVAEWWGEDAGLVVHEWAGFLVFVVVLVLVLVSVSVIRRLCPRAMADPLIEPTPLWVSPETTDGNTGHSRIIPGVVVVLAVVSVFSARHFDSLPVRSDTGVLLTADGSNPVALPAFIGTDWIGRTSEVTAIEREILPADTGFSRRSYVALHQPGHQVFLSIVLSGKDRSSIHRPELCVTGQGWTINGRSLHNFTYADNSRGTIPASVLRVEHEIDGGKRRLPALLAYWFVNSDRAVATHWERMLHGAWDRIRHGRADRWAYILVQTDATDGEDAAMARLQEVLDGTLPVFQKPLTNID